MFGDPLTRTVPEESTWKERAIWKRSYSMTRRRGRRLPEMQCTWQTRVVYNPTMPPMNTVMPTAIIVDGLSVSVTSDDLLEIFSPFGPVVWARVAMARSRQSLGFGYVVMDAEGAAKAIENLHGRTIAGRELTIARTTIPPLPRIA